jgi:hypothetical protein
VGALSPFIELGIVGISNVGIDNNVIGNTVCNRGNGGGDDGSAAATTTANAGDTN